MEGDPSQLWVIVGGEDVKQAHSDDHDERFARLVEWARPRFGLQSAEMRWSGMVMEPADYMAFIGANPGGRENVYVATGDSGHGMTHGTIAGMLIRDLVLGQPNPWARLYEPSRKTLSVDSLKEFLTENLDVARQYAKLSPTFHDADSAAEVPAGTGIGGAARAAQGGRVPRRGGGGARDERPVHAPAVRDPVEQRGARAGTVPATARASPPRARC